MPLYRVVFTNNMIGSIKPVGDDYPLEGELYYCQHMGMLVYAIIKATDKEAVRHKAAALINRFVSDK